MRVFYDERQSLHAPLRELHNGAWVPYAETPDRLRSVVAACDATEAPADFGLDPILAVHHPDYVSFLREAHEEWRAAGRDGDAIGYAFPVVHRRKLDLDRIDARIGIHSFDAATPITEGTWEAAYWSAQSAIAGAHAIGAGTRNAFAICRPPGHHAGADYMGGYCYLNNAAIAARYAQGIGFARVAVLDVDYHHGNGTQDIFWSDPSVLYASIHANPATDYPFFWGHADEHGGEEALGATLNFPLDRGACWDDYRPAFRSALNAVETWGADLMVLSFGADTFAGDPISHFRFETEDFAKLGRCVAKLGLRTLVVLEGGYAVGELGENVAALLAPMD